MRLQFDSLFAARGALLYSTYSKLALAPFDYFEIVHMRYNYPVLT